MHTSFSVKGIRSRSPGRLILRPDVRHIVRTERPTNTKLGTLVEYEDPYHRQAPTSKFARSRDTSDRCWPTHPERNVLETPRLAERLPTLRAIMHTSFKVKGQGHQID